MAGIRLIVILCVLPFSWLLQNVFTVFLMHLEYLHSKESVTANNVLHHPNSTLQRKSFLTKKIFSHSIPKFY